MRNLLAELQNWNYDAATDWTPKPGDILVGLVKGYSSSDSMHGVAETATIEEEESGRLVLIDLRAAELANLFKIHSPHVGERIGLKCLDKDHKGSQKQFVLIVDRNQDEDTSTAIVTETAEALDESSDEAIGATEEERTFIEEALGLQIDDAASDVEIYAAGSTGMDSALREIISRQDAEIHRLAKSLERLEETLSTAVTLVAGKSTAPAVSDTPTRTDSDSGTQPRRTRSWKKALLALVAMAAFCGMGVCAHFIFHIP